MRASRTYANPNVLSSGHDCVHAGLCGCNICVSQICSWALVGHHPESCPEAGCEIGVQTQVCGPLDVLGAPPAASFLFPPPTTSFPPLSHPMHPFSILGSEILSHKINFISK